MRLIHHLVRETMNPDNNPRMFLATMLFVVFCVVMSIVMTALRAP